MEPLFDVILKSYGPWGISLVILLLIVRHAMGALEKAQATLQAISAQLTKDFREELAIARIAGDKDRDMRHQHNEQLMAMLRTERKIQAAKEQ